jgi:hypothetical protein
VGLSVALGSVSLSIGVILSSNPLAGTIVFFFFKQQYTTNTIKAISNIDPHAEDTPIRTFSLVVNKGFLS